MKLKSLLLAAAGLTLYANSSFGIPAKPGFRTYTQPDGSQLSLQLIGDEFFHTLATTDGLSVAKGSDGFYYYQSAEGISDIRVACSPNFRPAYNTETTPAVDTNLYSVDSLIEARKNNIRKARAARAPQKIAKARQVPCTGSPKIPVLLVQYSDYKFKDKDPKATFTEFFSTGNVSAHQYFVDQSNGKYTPQFDVYGPVTLPNKRSYYGGNDRNGNDLRVGEMVGVGCQNLNSQINFADYDNDKDGECDVVIVLYAGDGEASSYDSDAENSVWPCQWELSSSDFGKSLKLDNTTVDKFAVFNELYGADLTQIDGIGTFCHEFSHCLDLPDFYDTQYGKHFGMGPWSLMDFGSYNNDGYTPIGYSAYEKAFMGWIEIEEGKENTLYNLPWFNQKNSVTDKAIKLTNPADSNEYFILENRKNQGWDMFMPAEGLFIYHVTYSEAAWKGNTVNDYDLQRMTPVPADNNLMLDKTSYGYTFNEKDVLGDLWPYKDATEFTDSSKPASKLNKGSTLGKPITEITKNSDGTISFWCMKAPRPTLSAPTDVKHSVIDNTSACISWDAAPESTPVTYSIEVSPHREITSELVISTVFNNAKHGWETDGYTGVEDGKGIRLGSNKNIGLIESPLFQGDDSGLVTVKINAASYGSDGTTMYVELLNDNYDTLDSAVSFPLASQYKDYVHVFEGEPQGNMYLWIYTDTTKKRFYVMSADIYTGDATGTISANTTRKAADSNSSITINGITGNSYTVTGLAEGAQYDYRVRKMAVDTDNWNHSAWSDKILLDMSQITGIETLPADENVTDDECVFISLQGHVLAERPTVPGIYIRKSSRGTQKFIVR